MGVEKKGDEDGVVGLFVGWEIGYGWLFCVCVVLVVFVCV